MYLFSGFLVALSVLGNLGARVCKHLVSCYQTFPLY